MVVKIEARILPGTNFHFPSTSVPPGTFLGSASACSMAPAARPQVSTNISCCNALGSKPAGRHCCCRSMGQAEERTSDRHRPRSTYYAGRVGNFMCNYPRRSGPSVNTSVIQPIHIISLSVEAKQTDALLFADYRSERTCLSSSAVTADSNKCYGEFQRRLTSIASDRTRRRHPHAYVCLVSCVLAVFVSINIGRSDVT